MSTSRLRTQVRHALPTALVGLFAGVAGVVGSYAVAGYTPAFVVSPVADLLRAVMPDIVIRYAITILGSLGQQLSLLTAFLLVIGGIGTLAALSMSVGERLNNRALPVVSTAVATWGVAVTLTDSLLLSFGAGLPAGAVVLLAEAVPSVPVATDVDEDRRTVVATALSVLGFSAVGYAVGQGRTGGGMPTGLGRSEELQGLLDDAAELSLGIAGVEPLVSEDFYTVDYSAIDPSVDREDWSLTVTGEVEEEVTVTMDDIESMETEDRFETLRCVGESLNGQKIDTALWTGVPIMDLVERANPDSGCGCVMLRAEDDYYEEFPIDAMEDGLLAYGMNGMELPRAHGFPVRALVPGHWGEINVKWISEIEILDREAEGYWEKQGWHGTGPVNTVAKLRAVNDTDDGRKELGGHAYAGTRGIETVEVSTDAGSTWNEAELSEPLPGGTDGNDWPDAWRQWRYTYDPPGDEHEVVVRATDRTGTLQPSEETGGFPSGPTGWVSRTVD
ncbi:molybdopterin-dependent oxidoreductase [Halorientalis salina]|uniref:molybdopterin-dependent oxidoreductase n=1 Tax=Halorientalis salina TaxID=2932266 RepID=UPI0010AC9742|nr:molybdopterin-dependent oxidoreductase [Halorientalis salina]